VFLAYTVSAIPIYSIEKTKLEEQVAMLPRELVHLSTYLALLRLKLKGSRAKICGLSFWLHSLHHFLWIPWPVQLVNEHFFPQPLFPLILY
jgi:hypothetical protein